MRYEARFINGYWALFDFRRYEPVDTFGLREQAVEAAALANSTGKWRITNAAEWHEGY
jgi:hypothetical protein